MRSVATPPPYLRWGTHDSSSSCAGHFGGRPQPTLPTRQPQQLHMQQSGRSHHAAGCRANRTSPHAAGLLSRHQSTHCELVSTLLTVAAGPPSMLQVMSKLAAEHQSVNLGQGFPDDEGPESMKQVCMDTTAWLQCADVPYQYLPTAGSRTIDSSNHPPSRTLPLYNACTRLAHAHRWWCADRKQGTL